MASQQLVEIQLDDVVLADLPKALENYEIYSVNVVIQIQKRFSVNVIPWLFVV